MSIYLFIGGVDGKYTIRLAATNPDNNVYAIGSSFVHIGTPQKNTLHEVLK